MWLVGIRREGEGFGIIAGGGERGHERIGNDIVANIAAHRPRETKIVDLDWRGVTHHHGCAGPLCIALEIDQNIDTRRVNSLRCLGVIQRREVMKGIKSRVDAAAHGLAIIGAKGESTKLEALAIMRLENLDQQHQRGMIVKIVRQVAYFDSRTRT